MNPKIIARHLPQFHEIPENNKWWGKGFTEWTTVKKARQLFRGHNQPRIPLEGYYDFLNFKTRKNQAELAKKFGLYGFCYYHYWFNGKKILEKGLEKMLEDGEPNINFCFSWANGSRSRTWGKKILDETLVKQEYGGKEDALNHIKYLMQFFKHKNYICVDNKPVFLIHNIKDIPDFDGLIAYWNDYCISKGFDGIYIIETLVSYNQQKESLLSSGVVQFEPLYSLGNMNGIVNILGKFIPYKIRSLAFQYITIFKNKLFGKETVYKVFYEKILKKIISFGNKKYKEKTFFGICPGWDNTPRKEERGILLLSESPELFEKYLQKQYDNSIKNGNEFLFINAWNERSEGAYLEPDKKFGFKYLEAIKKVINKT
ncbi:hypothetical protein P148_SR1C00001G0641 [candidate division SR1 bacterium RAAC1_SR1_1]|nr:hypothetical protein P148_SR1C00001G0641 [candidate division SR1 bacterium RAAC1_SR1_1]